MRFQATLSPASKLFAALVAFAVLAGAARADVLDDVKANGVVKCGVTLAPLESVCVKPGTPGRIPLAPGNIPNRWSNERFCMITTITFLIGTA